MVYGIATTWIMNEMHFEILVEDRSGKIALEKFVPKILGENCSYKIHPYSGIGHLPKNLNAKLDPSKRVLLNQLPRLLSGYGRSFANYPQGYKACVVVVCDLDDRDLNQFLSELEGVVDRCYPRPLTKFCLCIEEGEAWLLGHKQAVEVAYPNVRKPVLDAYAYDSICGTWEVLANAVYEGGAASLLARGKPEVGRMKSVWAEEIAPLIDIDENLSPSFQFFVRSLQKLAS